MKVLIVGGNNDYVRMWRKLGAELTADIFQADLVQFTGGEDVTPQLYGEEPHRYTGNNPARDIEEAGYYAIALRLGLPMVGICRGGQFLHVMNGGKMWQHVDGHATGHEHTCIDLPTRTEHKVTSTHHQQMLLGNNEGRLVAGASESTFKQRMLGGEETLCKGEGVEVEVLYYPQTSCLCFQPHPEFPGAASTLAYYTLLLNRYFGLDLPRPD